MADRTPSQAEHDLHALLRDLIAQPAQEGQVRSDVATDELALFCLHALAAAGAASSAAATQRMVGITLDGLRPRT